MFRIHHHYLKTELESVLWGGGGGLMMLGLFTILTCRESLYSPHVSPITLYNKI